ncbi:MAG: DUF3828 domain-containing protein [Anaerolineae bacterium]|nr:DUF3828 domain-containing protein [Anaerolineae bacterium]
MFKKIGLIGGLIVAAAVLLSACAAQVSAANAPNSTPEETVEAFYGWYFDYIGDFESGEFRNPMVDGVYHDSEYLTARFVTQVDELIASFEFGAYDPFLCAQAIPESLSVADAEIDGSYASVTVTSSFPNHRMLLLLVEEEGRWLIDDIQCQP